MRTIRLFLAHHSVAIQLAGWSIIIVLTIVDGYFDLPASLSVPFSAYVVLIGAPIMITASVLSPAPDNSLPKSLQNFIRCSPWFLGGWWCFCVFLLVLTVVEAAHTRSILIQR